MAARALYGKQRQALPQLRRLRKTARKPHKTPKFTIKERPFTQIPRFRAKSIDYGEKTSKKNGLPKAYGTLPKAQPPCRAPS